MKIVGCLDGVADGRIVGWARDEADPLGRLELFGWIDGRLVGRCLANRLHGSLAGVGDGYYGFSCRSRPPCWTVAAMSCAWHWPMEA